MTFYLLTLTYYNHANVGRNVLINSQLKRIIFMNSDKKKWNKTEKDRKNIEKEKNTDESDFSENKIQDLIFFETFRIWTKNKHMRYKQ